jgi:hypothetical protein
MAREIAAALRFRAACGQDRGGDGKRNPHGRFQNDNGNDRPLISTVCIWPTRGLSTCGR